MKRFFSTGSVAGLALAIAACGGGDAADDAGEADAPAPAPAPAPASGSSGAPSSADWVVVDQAARTVTISLVAGQNTSNNGWNFNGYSNGGATVVVPQGYAVTINFRNDDAVNVHSVAVLDAASTYPATFAEGMSPVFDGAMSSNATSMTEATATGGGAETITFTASSAGNYALVCLVPAHAISGMWIGFEVSASGASGVRM